MSPATATAPATMPTPDRERLRSHLSRYASSFAKVLPPSVTPDRIVTLTLVAATKTPKLFECTPESIVLSVMRVAQWGLEIGTTAYLVPFFDNRAGSYLCTPIAAWQGLIEMAIRTGHVRDVRPRVVYAREHFVVRYGVDDTIEHHPLFGDARGEPTHAYAVAALRNNRATFEVMSREEIERIRQASKSKDSDGWRKHYDEMMKKTVVRRLMKRLPQSRTLTDALDAEDALEGLPVAVVEPDAPARVFALGAVPAADPAPASEPVAAAPEPEAAAEATATAPEVEMTLERAKAYPFPFRKGTKSHGRPLDEFATEDLEKLNGWIADTQEKNGNGAWHAETLAAIAMLLEHREAAAPAAAVEPPVGEASEAPAATAAATSPEPGVETQPAPEPSAESLPAALQDEDDDLPF